MKADSFFTYYYLHMGLGYAIVSQILVACKDSLEKYLFEYDFMDLLILLLFLCMKEYLDFFFLFSFFSVEII